MIRYLVASKMPGLSNSLYVARLRYIQSVHEPLGRRNPDTLVKHFLPLTKRWRAAWLGREALSRLRADPFYYYLLARTTYYDQVIRNAVADDVKRIVNVGCGTDTRAQRFEILLSSNKVRVLECDQPEAIRAREQVAKRWRCADRVEYLPIDLNDGTWPALRAWLGNGPSTRTLVMMEGVSPYVNDSAIRRFLLFLSTTLAPSSQVAYDFKFRGFRDDFGRDGRTNTPFRQSPLRDEIESFHEAHGFRLEHLESSSELTARLLPSVAKAALPLFREDGLVQLRADSGLISGEKSGDGVIGPP